VSKPQINVTPLIDVLLVLLIIFMVVTPMKPSAFDARIPREPNDERNVPPHPDTLLITVNRDSTLTLNTENLEATVDDPGKLTNRLAEIFKTRETNHSFAETPAGQSARINRAVFIKASRSTAYGSVAKVVDAVKLAGADPVSLQIDSLD
jgi:biopolymer transport protein ExbD